ncbi:hypothetical protein U1Q18_025139 [Sarracenia purpurea var. burkii]
MKKRNNKAKREKENQNENPFVSYVCVILAVVACGLSSAGPVAPSGASLSSPILRRWSFSGLSSGSAFCGLCCISPLVRHFGASSDVPGRLSGLPILFGSVVSSLVLLRRRPSRLGRYSVSDQPSFGSAASSVDNWRFYPAFGPDRWLAFVFLLGSVCLVFCFSPPVSSLFCDILLAGCVRCFFFVSSIPIAVSPLWPEQRLSLWSSISV